MAFLALPTLAMAAGTAVDTLDPLKVSRTIGVGESFDVTKTITVVQGAPVDILFVADTTTGMQSVWNDGGWSTKAGNLISAAFGVSPDVRVGVGTYEDFPATQPNEPGWGQAGDSPWDLIQAFTSSSATAASALSGLGRPFGDGGDEPEAGIHALGEAANLGTWRSDAVKIVVWLGDQPGHIASERYGGTVGGVPTIFGTYPGGYDTSDVIAAMVSQGVLVEAFDFLNLDGSLNEQYYSATTIDSAQATAITSGTGGHLYSGASFSNLETLFGQSLLAAYLQYTVGLDVSNLPAGLSLSIAAPADVTGDRTQGDESFQWVLTFTGDNPGVYTFPIYGLINGARFATELDSITVLRDGQEPGPGIPEPTTFALLGLGLLGVGIAARRRKK
jgi:hypothetical protein